jgi:hypothetical protein
MLLSGWITLLVMIKQPGSRVYSSAGDIHAGRLLRRGDEIYRYVQSANEYDQTWWARALTTIGIHQ